MDLAAIRFRNTEDHIYPRGRTELAVSLSTARGDVDSVTLVWWPRYETESSSRRAVAVKRELRDAYLDHYRALIQTDGISAYTRYALLFASGGKTVRLGKNGFSEPEDGENFFEFLWPNPTDAPRAPDWASEQVYYQIFPERFRNGDASNDPPGTEHWGAPPTRGNFMGGDLRGIIEKLDYIRDLGATCLYLTPIFKAPSNHKYDTVDYFDIDPAFGTKDDLAELVRTAHKLGLRVLLDGVFNHCGYYWPPFQDVVKHGESSGYASWFFPQSFPINERLENYDCVGHYKWMPKIHLADASARDYFITVGKYWIRNFHIDGWRLDVADEAPTQFWEHFSDAIKKENPGALLLGETWADAHRLLAPNRLDSAMNYLFRDAAADWLAKDKIRPAELDHRLNRMLSLYPWETALRLYNPLDSHDTERFRWLCRDKRRHALAIALQMAFPGCPAVFYGDEVGLTGGNDPDCRLAMEWDEKKQDKELFAYYRKLIGIRRESPSLLRGDFRTCLCDDASNVYAFHRKYGEDESIVVLNAGNEPVKTKIAAGGTWTPRLGGRKPVSSENGEITVDLAPCSAEIYKKKAKGRK